MSVKWRWRWSWLCKFRECREVWVPASRDRKYYYCFRCGMPTREKPVKPS